MEKIKKFNLEVASFVRDLKSYVENVNEIDDETINLLVETIIAVNKLQNNSKFRENSTSNENNFVSTLDNEIFECRRYIVCRLCHENIPLSFEDFEVHTQKKSHKEKKINLQSKNKRMNENNLLQTASNISINSLDTSSSHVISNESEEGSSQCSFEILPDWNPVEKLEDVTDVGKDFALKTFSDICIKFELAGFKFPTAARIHNEKQILNLLTRYSKALDAKTELVPFGSSTYGFGEPDTNFNILFVSAENPIKALHSFGKIMNTFEPQSEFEVLPILHCDRVYKRRLPITHKESKIVCWIQFGCDFELAEASQVIRDSIVHVPLCYHLIACIRSWQISLNDVAVENDLEVFHFNTYIIAVLVIFFLQVNKIFPKLKDLPSCKSKCINHVECVACEPLRQTVRQFFDFYGNIYQIDTQLISVNIGRLQEQQMPPQQKSLSPEQTKLREGIASNHFNWENCTMFVQDIKSLGTNITAEITKEEANNFKKMCQLFSSDNSDKSLIGEYMIKLPQVQPISLNSTNIIIPTIAKKLEDFVDIEDVDKLTKVEMDQILAISMNSEQEIINSLSVFLKERYSIQTVAPFGSVTYGFGGPKTNLNIMIIAGESVSTFDTLQIQTSFENAIKTSGLQQDFEFESQLKANRVRKEQLQIVHKKSRIQCILQFGTESDLHHSQETTKIILKYFRVHPMCKPLIAYVRGWQNVLNDVASKNGQQAFNFNMYIISVLVIYYLQMNHKLPVIKNLTSNQTTFPSNGDLAQFVEEFFVFYGNAFGHKTHLISVNVGRWQQIESEGQRHFTPEQKSMRDDMKICPNNWSNCSMYVQDLVSTSTNITAEIPKQDVENFVRMCRIFSKHTPKISVENQSLDSPTNPVNQLLANGNQAGDLVQLIERKIAEAKLPSCLEARRSSEIEIISILTKYIRRFDPFLSVYSCGSTQYGIQLLNANLNLLVTTSNNKRDMNAEEVSQFFLFTLDKTGIANHFKVIGEIGANRAIQRQISMIHIKTGINCTIFFGKDDIILKSTKVLSRFTADPLCNYLTTFIKTWQDVLKELRIARFEFNTYTVSTLVIFFLQMEYGEDCFPTVDQLLQTDAKVKSNKSDFKQVLRQFFHFYGNRYQIWNHVISINIGRWQERRLQSNQHSFTQAQKRLRDGIAASPKNWANCTMYIQDVIRPDVNIAAEIPQGAANNFQEMCQQYAKKMLN